MMPRSRRSSRRDAETARRACRRLAAGAAPGSRGVLLDRLAHPGRLVPPAAGCLGRATGPRARRAPSAWSTSSARMSPALCSRVTMPTLWPGHQRAVLDIAVDHRAAQRAGPEMLDLELRLLVRHLAAIEAVDHRALGLAEAPVAALASARTGITGNSRVELHRRHRVARCGADKGRLKRGWAVDSVGADEPGADLHARRRPFADRPASPRHGRCRRRRTPAPRSDAAGSPVPGRRSRPVRYGRRPRMPSMTIASAPVRTSLLAIAKAGAKQMTRAPPRFRRRIAAARRHAAGEHDMARRGAEADLDQLGRAAGAW